MKEIKFRGKRIDNGEWVYGYYVVRGGMPFIFSFAKEPQLVIPETVGQYTGLQDKNGKEIYEGDICRKTHALYQGSFIEIVEHQKINGVIFWASQVGKFMFRDTDNNCWDFKQIQTNKCLEVIGNAHDKPAKGEKI